MPISDDRLMQLVNEYIDIIRNYVMQDAELDDVSREVMMYFLHYAKDFLSSFKILEHVKIDTTTKKISYDLKINVFKIEESIRHLSSIGYIDYKLFDAKGMSAHEAGHYIFDFNLDSYKYEKIKQWVSGL